MAIYFKQYLGDTAPVLLFTVSNVKVTPPSHFLSQRTPVSISWRGPFERSGCFLPPASADLSGSFLPTPLPSLATSSILRVVSHLNEQLGSFISYKYWIRLIALVPLGVANWFYPRMYRFSCFLFFPLTKRKNLSVNKPLRSGRLKTQTSPTLQRYSQLGCVKLN